MSKRNNRLLHLAAFVLCSAMVLDPASAETFTFSGNRVETVFAKGRERTRLSGNAEVISDTTWIHADEIELFGKDFVYAIATGNVRLINTDNGIELSCQKLFYDRGEKIARIQGNATMVDRKNEIVIKGGFIEHHEREKITNIQIGVRILKKDMSCRAEFARYFKDQDRLELSGMPVVYWKDDEYRASRIYIDLANDQIRLEGDVRGALVQREDSKGAATSTDAGVRGATSTTTDAATGGATTTNATTTDGSAGSATSTSATTTDATKPDATTSTSTDVMSTPRGEP